jgi:hypothetical protein
MGVSFRSHSGNYCRTFVLRDGSALAGLACHEQSEWKLQVLAASEQVPSDRSYRTAASALSPAIAGRVEALIAGEPLDAAGEAAAREQGWSH